MQRRTFIAALLASPTLIALLQACGNDEKNDPSEAEGQARSDKSRLAAAANDAGQATTSVNDFGVDLYNALVGTDAAASPNLVFSPASITVALAMTRLGAMGTTAAEMDTVLHITDPAKIAHSMNALTTALETRSKQVDIPGADAATVELSIANSLWGQEGLAFEAAFLDVLATEYGAGLQLVDYKADPNGARKLINAWVEDATNDRIPELIPQGVITADTRLTLVNAIYMKAPWLTKFNDSATTPMDFTTSDGTVVQVPTMASTDRLEYVAGEGWQAVALPYQGNELSMVIALPDAGADLADSVAAIAGVAIGSSATDVNLLLPRFDIETSISLADVLKAMGMPAAFGLADFSGITAEVPLSISAVVHQANITVDEEGTEAAAATAVIVGETSAAPPDSPIEFVVDRPFAFAIRDDPTGAILFLGHIGDPAQTRN